LLFVLNAPAAPALYPLSLHDALPIFVGVRAGLLVRREARITDAGDGQPSDLRDPVVKHHRVGLLLDRLFGHARVVVAADVDVREDRKSTRLNSSHVKISYAVFCLKKK